MMYYRKNTEPDAKNLMYIENGQLEGLHIENDINHLASLMEADNISEDPPLLKESFVIAIQGGWGVGKTWSSNAFINKLSDQPSFDKLHVFKFDLLPFANINESVTNILCNISRSLYDDGIVDVRKEFSQMILDSTPANEYNAGISIFGLNLSRKISYSKRNNDNKTSIVKKFNKLSIEGHRFLVMLDDLDRLKPDEVVVVIRMIESFKFIPGYIFVLPFNRDAVSNSIKVALSLDEPSTHVYLRKFIKASITINLKLENLKKTFIKEIQIREASDGASSAIHDRFGMNVGELTWYIFLHILLIREAISKMGDDPDANAVVKIYNNSQASHYLFTLPQKLGLSKKPNENPSISSLPYVTDNKIQRFAEVYGSLSDPTASVPATISQLESLLNEETLTNYIIVEPSIIERLRTSAEIPYEEIEVSKAEKTTVFEELILPILSEDYSEPLLITNYSRRDIVQLASAINKDPDFSIVSNPLESIKTITKVCKSRYLEFR